MRDLHTRYCRGPLFVHHGANGGGVSASIPLTLHPPAVSNANSTQDADAESQASGEASTESKLSSPASSTSTDTQTSPISVTDFFVDVGTSEGEVGDLTYSDGDSDEGADLEFASNTDVSYVSSDPDSDLDCDLDERRQARREEGSEVGVGVVGEAVVRPSPDSVELEGKFEADVDVATEKGGVEDSHELAVRARPDGWLHAKHLPSLPEEMEFNSFDEHFQKAIFKIVMTHKQQI